MKFPAHLNKQDSTRELRRIDCLVGPLACAVAALSVSLLAAGHPWQVFVPLAFSAFLLWTAARFGTRAGISGTLVAALVFAVFLFNPRGKVQVASEAERHNLIWMMLMGAAFSFFFAPPASGLRRP